MVRHLLIKKHQGQSLCRSMKIDVRLDGIVGNVPCLPLRQVLLLPSSTLADFSLEPGDLRENVVIDGINLHDLQSGTILKVGEVKIHLTFHCEPCKVISDKVNLRAIKHQRGVLGRFITIGSVRIGDSVIIETGSLIPFHTISKIGSNGTWKNKLSQFQSRSLSMISVYQTPTAVPFQVCSRVAQTSIKTWSYLKATANKRGISLA